MDKYRRSEAKTPAISFAKQNCGGGKKQRNSLSEKNLVLCVLRGKTSFSG